MPLVTFSGPTALVVLGVIGFHPLPRKETEIVQELARKMAAKLNATVRAVFQDRDQEAWVAELDLPTGSTTHEIKWLPLDEGELVALVAQGKTVQEGIAIQPPTTHWIPANHDQAMGRAKRYDFVSKYPSDLTKKDN